MLFDQIRLGVENTLSARKLHLKGKYHALLSKEIGGLSSVVQWGTGEDISRFCKEKFQSLPIGVQSVVKNYAASASLNTASDFDLTEEVFPLPAAALWKRNLGSSCIKDAVDIKRLSVNSSGVLNIQSSTLFGTTSIVLEKDVTHQIPHWNLLNPMISSPGSHYWVDSHSLAADDPLLQKCDDHGDSLYMKKHDSGSGYVRENVLIVLYV